MPVKLSELERRLYDTLEATLRYLTKRHISKVEYAELMADICKTMHYVDSYLTGCPQGLHRDNCTCTKEKKGWHEQYAAILKRNGSEGRAGHGRYHRP